MFHSIFSLLFIIHNNITEPNESDSQEYDVRLLSSEEEEEDEEDEEIEILKTRQ
jgi:hypothetical protein